MTTKTATTTTMTATREPTGEGIMNRVRNIILGLVLTLGFAATAQAAISVSITGPANNTVVLAPGSFTITATASNAQGAPLKSVAFYANNGTTNTLLGTIAAPTGSGAVTLPGAAAAAPIATASSTTYTWNWTNVPMGIYTLTAVATDMKGGTGTSAPVTVVVDVPPTVNFTAPANNTVITAPATFTFSASANAPIGTIAKVEFYNGSTLIGTATSAPFSVQWANVPWGTYSITAKATDNWSISNTTGPITVISNQPPTVNLTGPANNTVAVAPGTFAITANAADIDGTVAKVDFYAANTTGGTAGTPALIGTVTTSATGTYGYTWTNVPAGTYTLTAIATDNWGATTTSAPIPVVSDAPPAVSITSPANNSTSGAPGSFNLTASATSQIGTIAKVEFYNGSTLLGTATAAPYTFAWSNVAVGSYSVTAKATDSYGISATSAVVALMVTSGSELSLYFIHADHLSTPRLVTDANGNPVWQWDDSDPFGNNVPNENPGNLGVFHFPLRFPGQYFDTETNLAYNVNRDYDAATGRYIQSDPLGLAGGVNTFSYVISNPMGLVDPLGLQIYKNGINGNNYSDSPFAGPCAAAIMGGGAIVGWGPCDPGQTLSQNSGSDAGSNCPTSGSQTPPADAGPPALPSAPPAAPPAADSGSGGDGNTAPNTPAQNSCSSYTFPWGSAPKNCGGSCQGGHGGSITISTCAPYLRETLPGCYCTSTIGVRG